LKHEYKFVTPVQITMKISEVSTKTLKDYRWSSKVFRRWSKFTWSLPKIAKDNWTFSEHFQKSPKQISPKHFQTPSTLTQTLPKISEDHPKIAEDHLRLLNIVRSFANIFGNFQIFEIPRTLQPA